MEPRVLFAMLVLLNVIALGLWLGSLRLLMVFPPKRPEGAAAQPLSHAATRAVRAVEALRKSATAQPAASAPDPTPPAPSTQESAETRLRQSIQRWRALNTGTLGKASER